MALRASAVQAEPLIHPGSSTTPSLIPAPVETDDRGDVLIRGMWVNRQDAIINVRITDTDQPSAKMRDPAKVLQSQEKKRMFLKACQQQRRAFTPFVTSVDGLLGLEARSVLKRLAQQLAVKWQKQYSRFCGIVCSCISIACVRASHQCIRSTRIPVKKMSRRI